MDTIALGELASLLNQHRLDATLEGDPSVAVAGAACDSRQVTPGNIFVCKGAAFRPAFLSGALEAGAVAYLCTPDAAGDLAAVAPGVPRILCADIRPAMAWVSKAAWGNPDQDLEIVGITGTKGKSTTAYLLQTLLDAVGPEPCAIFGTHAIFDGTGTYESANTTPEPPDLWRHLANVKRSGLRRVVMEVSSQALKYDRVLGLSLSVACFLNIGNDHVSPVEHPSFEDYLASKLRIFELTDRCVVNLSTGHAEEVMAAAGRADAVPLTYALSDPAADVFATDVAPADHGMDFTCHTPAWTREAFLSLLGEHNVEDALAAVACAQALGVRDEKIMDALAHACVPGRMEVRPTADGAIVTIVDYAHNDISYRRFFDTVDEFFPGAYKVAFFGVSGGKALDRYRDLPAIGSRRADYVILTSDDPGPEDPAELCHKIAANLAPDTAFAEEPDREAACELAFAQAMVHVRQTGGRAVVCALGKGAETEMRIGQRDVPYEPDGAHLARLVAAYDAEVAPQR
ncbi:Mur ligase family protein [Atopobiaceae bacterium 24-176]